MAGRPDPIGLDAPEGIKTGDSEPILNTNVDDAPTGITWRRSVPRAEHETAGVDGAAGYVDLPMHRRDGPLIPCLRCAT